MKKILFIILPLLVFNCRNDIQVDRLQSKLNFESEFIQQFKVAPDSIIEVIGKKGTRIIFNSNDLEGILDGPNIKDSLSVNLIELSTKQDLLLANTQTISNGKWLISGGAFKIEIYGYGPLELKKGKNIKVELPKTTVDNDMQLFYGERGLNNNMNWTLSDIDLQEKKFFSVYYKEVTVIDEELSSRFGDVDNYDFPLEIDTLGYITLSDYNSRYSEIDSLYNTNDTISNLKSWKDFEDFTSNINNSRYALNDIVYSSIEISKLGWINIDKFAPEEEKVSIKFTFSENLDANNTYIIDETNNTILNVFESSVEIPIKRSFYIISFGLKGDTIYAFKKSIRFSENTTYKIELKKVNENQLKSILTLKQ